MTLMLFEIAQFNDVTLAISFRRGCNEPRGMQRTSQRVQIVKKLMSPPVKRAVDLEAAKQFFLGGHLRRRLVMRQPDPIEIRRRQTQHSVIRQCATALFEKLQTVRECQVLNEMFREHEIDILEGKAVTNVGQYRDAVIGDVVDIDPARQRDRSRADVQLHENISATCSAFGYGSGSFRFVRTTMVNRLFG